MNEFMFNGNNSMVHNPPCLKNKNICLLPNGINLVVSIKQFHKVLMVSKCALGVYSALDPVYIQAIFIRDGTDLIMKIMDWIWEKNRIRSNPGIGFGIDFFYFFKSKCLQIKRFNLIDLIISMLYSLLYLVITL